MMKIEKLIFDILMKKGELNFNEIARELVDNHSQSLIGSTFIFELNEVLSRLVEEKKLSSIEYSPGKCIYNLKQQAIRNST